MTIVLTFVLQSLKTAPEYVQKKENIVVLFTISFFFVSLWV
jgi:hypothetical protein